MARQKNLCAKLSVAIFLNNYCLEPNLNALVCWSAGLESVCAYQPDQKCYTNLLQIVLLGLVCWSAGLLEVGGYHPPQNVTKVNHLFSHFFLLVCWSAGLQGVGGYHPLSIS